MSVEVCRLLRIVLIVQLRTHVRYPVYITTPVVRGKCRVWVIHYGGIARVFTLTHIEKFADHRMRRVVVEGHRHQGRHPHQCLPPRRSSPLFLIPITMDCLTVRQLFALIWGRLIVILEGILPVPAVWPTVRKVVIKPEVWPITINVLYRFRVRLPKPK